MNGKIFPIINLTERILLQTPLNESLLSYVVAVTEVICLQEKVPLNM